MESDLDLNSFRVINSGAPVLPHDLVRLMDITSQIENIVSAVLPSKADVNLGNVSASDLGSADIALGLSDATPLKYYLAEVPETFGAVSTDLGPSSGTANSAAVNAAAVANKPIDGRGRTYAINGNITVNTIGATVNLRNMHFKQTASAAKAILFQNLSNVEIDSCILDMSNFAATSTLSESVGVCFRSCTNVKINRLIIINGAGHTGLQFEDCSNLSVNRVIVSDFVYEAGAVPPTDDVIQGIAFTTSTNWSATNCMTVNLTANWTGRPNPWRRFSRGLATGGCSNFSIINHYSAFVDQGIDITGGATGNFNGIVANYRSTDCSTFGLKLANRARDIRIVGGMIQRSGWAGVVISNQFSGDTTVTSSWIDVEGVTVTDTGANSIWTQSDGRNSFQILSSGLTGTEGNPGGVRFINCSSFDRQATKTTDAHYAIRGASTVRPFDSTVPVNQLINCRGDGLAVGGTFQIGFNFPYLKASGTTTQLHNSNGGLVTILWTTTPSNTSSTYDSATGRLHVKTRGYYLLSGQVSFDGASATGRREIRLFKNGSVFDSATDSVRNSDASGLNLRVPFQAVVFMAPGDYIDIRAYQNSGGNLNMQLSQSFVDFIKIADA